MTSITATRIMGMPTIETTMDFRVTHGRYQSKRFTLPAIDMVLSPTKEWHSILNLVSPMPWSEREEKRNDDSREESIYLFLVAPESKH